MGIALFPVSATIVIVLIMSVGLAAVCKSVIYDNHRQNRRKDRDATRKFNATPRYYGKTDSMDEANAQFDV